MIFSTVRAPQEPAEEAHHLLGDFGHLADQVHRFRHGFVQQGQAPLCDIHREIAHPLQIAVDFEHGDQQPHIARHRLIPGHEGSHEIIQFNLHLVHADLVFDDLASIVFRALQQATDASMDGTRHHVAHYQQVVLKNS